MIKQHSIYLIKSMVGSLTLGNETDCATFIISDSLHTAAAAGTDSGVMQLYISTSSYAPVLPTVFRLWTDHSGAEYLICQTRQQLPVSPDLGLAAVLVCQDTLCLYCVMPAIAGYVSLQIMLFQCNVSFSY